MKKQQSLLAVLVNFGEEQLDYLQDVVNSLKSFKKYNVTVIVQSNIPLKIEGVDKVNIVKLEDYQLLPLTCRKEIWDRKDDYDVFLYGENDHLFKEHHIDKHIEYTSILPENRITGLIQYEENEFGFLVKDRDYIAMSDKIINVISTPDKYTFYSKSAILNAKSYDYLYTTNKYIELYRALT